MEKQIVWTYSAQTDFWTIVSYLNQHWPESVVNDFNHALNLKTQLLQKQPGIGSKSK